MNLKAILLKYKVTRNILFFIFHKKVNKRFINYRIRKYKYKRTEVGDFVVSLTSFPDRIQEVQYTVFSMLKQSISPKKIFLWLAEEQFPNKEVDLPKDLRKLQNDIFEIKWCKDLRSYKKLIPLIENNIYENVIICDDDIYYRKKTLEILWKEHLEYESNVICHIGKELIFDNNHKIIPYIKWNWVTDCINKKNVLPIGGGCVLYPKSVLYNSPLLLDNELSHRLAKYADDIWFWYSIVSAGYCVNVPKRTIKKMIFTNPEREYGINDGFTLTKVNEGQDMNDIQLQNIVNNFQFNLFNFTQG